jgi:hypothetical protein
MKRNTLLSAVLTFVIVATLGRVAEAQSTTLADILYAGNVLPNLEPDPAKRWTAEVSGSPSSIGFENGTDFLRIVDTSSTLAIYQRLESAATSTNRVDFEFRARFFGAQSNACFGHADENFRYVVWKLNTGGMQIQSGTGPTIPVPDLSQWHVYRAERDGMNVVRFYIDGNLVAAKAYLDLQQRSGRAKSIHFGACGTADTANFDLDYLRYSITPASPEPSEVFYPGDTLPNRDPIAPWRADPSDVTGGVSLSGDGLLLFRDTSSQVSIYQRNVTALQSGASWTIEFRANYRSGTLWVAALSELNGRWAGICFGDLSHHNVVTDCGGLGISSTSLSLTIAGVDPRGWHTWRVEKDGLVEARIYRDGLLIRTAPYTQLPMATARKGAAIFGAGGTATTADVDLDYLHYRIGPVTPVNNAPVANNQSVTTNEDTSASITLTGSDPDGNSLTFSVVSSPSHGTLTGAVPNLTYTPAANYYGSDGFAFKATDGTLDSNIATVSLTINSVNDAAVASSQSVTTNEDTAAAITLAGSDVDGDSLTFSVVGSPGHGALSGTAPNLTYTPAPNYSGSDSFTFKSNDGSMDSNIATVSITVMPVNDAPVATPQSFTTDEDVAKTITLVGSDFDGDTISFNVVTPPSHGTLSGTAPNLIYTPAANYYGSDNLTFKTNDGGLDSNTATVSITVTPVNDAPVATAQSFTTDEDVAKAITLTGSDIDGDAITFSVVANPTHGSLGGTAPNLTYTPAANYFGSDTFTFKTNDGTMDSNIATVSLTINSVNDPPVALGSTVVTLEDNTVVVTLSGSDVDGDSLSFTVMASPAHGALAGSPPALTYSPAPNYNGPDQFTFVASDGSTTSAAATINITVTPVNDAPDAIDDQVTLTVTSVTVAVLSNDVDIDGDRLSISTTSAGNYGTTAANPNGTITYVLRRYAMGTDTFSYSVVDGNGGTDTAKVIVALRLSPSDGIGLVIGQIATLDLNNGEKNSLSSKLSAAQRSLSSGNRQAASGQLGAVINEIQALQRSGRLDGSTAEALLAQLRAIQEGI